MRQPALTLDLRTDPVDWHSMTGWKRLVLMGLMVALPVPLFAASGLAVPLPSIVYRVAVGVAERTQAVAVQVPGFEAVIAETKQVARRGTIRLAPEELEAVAASARASASRPEDRASKSVRSRDFAGRSDRRPTPTKLVLRAAPVESAGAKEAAPAHETQTAAAPQAPHAPSHSGAAAEKKPEPVAADEPRGGSTTTPEPRANPAKEEPNSGPDPAPPPPPPSPVPPPPSSLPPLPVTPPVDPLPDPLPLTPKAQLEEIGAELRAIVVESPGTRRAQRVAQALDKVKSAVARLEQTPPDNQGAVGDIRDAVQKLDAATAEGVLSLSERTHFVTRLNAVSLQLKAAAQ